MSAPYRIYKPGSALKQKPTSQSRKHRPAGAAAAMAPTASTADSINSYLDRLMKMFPVEVVSLYLVGNGLIPAGQKVALVVWAIVCLIGVVAIRIYGTSDPKLGLKPDYIHVGISSGAFIVWLYSVGGPFAAFNLYIPYVGSLLVLAWTFFIPVIYKGQD